MEEKTIETRRLILRPHTIDDAEAVAALLCEREVTRWLSRVPHPYGRADAAAWIGRQQHGDPRNGIYAIAFKAMPDVAIGTVSYEHLAGQDAPEFGYWLGRPYWGRRLMSEAAAALVHHAFSAAGIEELASGYWNPVSGRLLSRLGFVETGKRKTLCLATHEEVESTRLSLTRAMWQAQKQSRAA